MRALATAARAALRRLGASLELRWRLSLVVGLLLTAALAIAALIAVSNARVAVSHEVDTSLRTATASLDLTLHLLAGRDDAEREAVLRQWARGYAGARHLCVALDTARAPDTHCALLATPSTPGVPDWFAQGAAFGEPPVTRELALSAQTLRLHLLADPRDELREAWEDVRSLLWMMGALAFAVNLGVFLAVSYALRPLDRLVRAMDRIGRGLAPETLPQAGAPEVLTLSRGLAELAERIARARDEVRALHLRNLDLQEDERRMVARELHDEIGQHVTAIEMETIRLARLPADEVAQRAARLQQLRDSVAQIHRVSRRLVDRLRPPSVETLGPAGAVEALCDRWRAEHPEPLLTVDIAPECERLPRDRAVHLYRLVQESLSNAARHAQARKVWVRVDVQDGRVHLRVTDDGAGFDPAARARRPGYGLAGLRERAEALGGRFELHSRPGAGTVVEAEFPLRGG